MNLSNQKQDKYFTYVQYLYKLLQTKAFFFYRLR